MEVEVARYCEEGMQHRLSLDAVESRGGIGVGT
jgi:hypothetical protein